MTSHHRACVIKPHKCIDQLPLGDISTAAHHSPQGVKINEIQNITCHHVTTPHPTHLLDESYKGDPLQTVHILPQLLVTTETLQDRHNTLTQQ